VGHKDMDMALQNMFEERAKMREYFAQRGGRD
jgi:hypothetical protein